MRVWRFSLARLAALIFLVLFPICLPGIEPGEPARPRARSLAELGSSITLNRSALQSTDDQVVISNTTVVAMRDRGLITTCAAPSAAASETVGGDHKPADPGRRSFWRKKVAAQKRSISKAEAAVAKIDARLDGLLSAAFGGGKGTVKTWARIDEARANRKIAQAKVRDEKKELSRLIRDARKEGAQPGWFR